ncbi:MAG: hypothetical protein GY948_15080 [Alphaproteobacteria bacterium]|nr:hypothetical protein [Alphaproteobacteria bacterium]
MMPYWIHQEITGPSRMEVFRYEPEIEVGPEFPKNVFSSILKFGRAQTDVPGTKTEFVEEMLALAPKSVLIGKPGKRGVPDFFEIRQGYVISHRLVEKLEQLEPGAHRFFPLQIKRQDTGENMGEHFLLYLDQKPDIIDHDRTLYGQSSPATGVEAGERVNFRFTQVGYRERPDERWDSPLINFRQGGAESCHLWRGTVGDAKWHRVDRTPGGTTYYSDPLCSQLFVSDELQSLFRAGKLFGWNAQKVLEKPPSWFFEQLEKGVVF